MSKLPHNWIDATAERIIKVEGLTFAMACLPPQKELAEARGLLKDAIVRELERAYRAGQS